MVTAPVVTTSTRLLDHRGRPIERRRLTEEVAAPTVTGVRSPMGGYSGDGLNPQRLATILREADAGNPIRQMELAETVEERDPHILGILGTRKRSVSQLDVTVEDGSNDSEHIRQAQMVRDWLMRDELQSELFDMLDAIHKGYSFTEIMWDTSEGQWSPGLLEWRDPRWFEFEPHNLRTPLLIDENGQRVDLVPGKFIYAQMAAKSGLPARSGLSRTLAWVWLFKALSNRDWAIFTQTYGQPIRLGKYGQGATESDRQALFRAIANVAGDMAAMIPASMDIEFIESKSVGASSDLYDKRVTHLNLEASKAVLGQTTTTDAVSGGHAVSQEHRLVQEDIERSDAKQLAAVINRDLVRVWIDLQYGPQTAYPRIRIGRPEQKDVDLIARTVRAFRLPIKKSEAYQLAGVSQPEETDEVIVPGAADPARPGEEKPAGARRPGLPAPDEDETDEDLQGELDPVLRSARREEQAIDGLTEEAAQLLDRLMTRFLSDIVKDPAVRDLEDVRRRLLELSPAIGTKPMARALRQAIVVAELSGRADLIDG